MKTRAVAYLLRGEVGAPFEIARDRDGGAHGGNCIKPITPRSFVRLHRELGYCRR